MSARGIDVSPDTLITAGSYVNREYGLTGYTFEAIECFGRYVTAFRVRCSDGGRFFVIADRWGNCESLTCDGGQETERLDNPELLATVDRMDRKARTP